MTRGRESGEREQMSKLRKQSTIEVWHKHSFNALCHNAESTPLESTNRNGWRVEEMHAAFGWRITIGIDDGGGDVCVCVCLCGTNSYSHCETCVSTNRSINRNGFILDLTLWIMTVVMTSFGAWRWHLGTVCTDEYDRIHSRLHWKRIYLLDEMEKL